MVSKLGRGELYLTAFLTALSIFATVGVVRQGHSYSGYGQPVAPYGVALLMSIGSLIGFGRLYRHFIAWGTERGYFTVVITQCSSGSDDEPRETMKTK